MGTPNNSKIIISTRCPSQEPLILMEPFVPQAKYQDIKITVKSTDPEVSYSLGLAMIGPVPMEKQQKQVCIGKICGLC